jgi:hypothetical protein
VSIRISDIEDKLREHMEDQPYTIKCAECGAKVEVETAEIDSEFDIHITVEPCECVEEEA